MVSSSTQNQALNAIVFLYSQVLRIDLGDFGRFERSKTAEKPLVFDEGGSSARIERHNEPSYLRKLGLPFSGRICYQYEIHQ
jgi:hypothetical protein